MKTDKKSNTDTCPTPLLPTPPRELVDLSGRRIRYLRLSVTDRCNLRCSYCWGCATMKFIPHSDILRYEEMFVLVEAAVDMGVEKLRLTGGEPLTRKGLVPFIATLRERWPALDIRLTTNATLLAPHVPALKELGVNGINISLDSFRHDISRAVTGRDMLTQTMTGIHTALDAGIPLKLNAVALRGVNDDQMPLFLDFAKKYGIEVRFIEFMPMGSGTEWTEENYWPAQDILAKAREFAAITPLPREKQKAGTAQLFHIDGGPARLGLITPMSNHFCDDCNRLRITPDGRLRTCLFSDREYKLRPMLRNPKLGINAVKAVFARANLKKPHGYRLLDRNREGGAVAHRHMTSIGG